MRKTLLFLLALFLGVGFLPAAHAAVNDPMADKQYGYTQIQAPSAWTKSTGAGVTIAIVDGGTDIKHEDLASKITANCPYSGADTDANAGCWDYGDGDGNPQDDTAAKGTNGSSWKGHGTHTAGLAAAATNNDKGVVGIAPDARIMPIKIAGDNTTTVQDFIGRAPQAVQFAVSHHAKVINLSIVELVSNPVGLNNAVQNACESAFTQGSLCVVAAGNSGEAKASGYSVDFNGLIVTANDKNGNHADFGQKADTKWSVSAPGVGNLSTWPMDSGKYSTQQGTSMAAPHVAGVAALVFAQHPDWSPAQVAERIVSTANPMGAPSTNGAGRVNAAAAVGAPVVAPTDPGTKGKSSGNTYKPPSGSSGSGGSSGSSGGGSSGGSTKATLPPEGSSNDADFNGIGANTNVNETTAKAAKTKSASKITSQQLLETVATILLLMAGISTLSARKRFR